MLLRKKIGLDILFSRLALLLALQLPLLGFSSTTISIQDSVQKSTAAEAIAYLQSIKNLRQSKWWPNVNPTDLLLNLETFTTQPFSFYEGTTTNFCAYSSLTFIPLKYDPLGFARFMIALYQHGEARMGKDIFKPRKSVRKEAGLLKFKGALDINMAGQMWFLTLADKYKGYINFFNRRFRKGDENTLWAATNYAKFNKMLRRLFHGKIKSKGSDIIRPSVKNMYEYITNGLKDGMVFIYVNNKKLYKKTHTKPILNTATHYVLLNDICKADDGDILFSYWEYGKKTYRKLSPRFLKNIIYGITIWKPATR